MGFLQTRYGVGGTVNYWVNNAISLHAFGYYYPNSSLISPAVNPYLGTTNYGGYADIRFHKNFGVDAGARRYLSPMTGKWVTDPIVSSITMSTFLSIFIYLFHAPAFFLALTMQYTPRMMKGIDSICPMSIGSEASKAS